MPAAPAPVASGSLAGRTVLLDPGHNGGNASHPAEINRLVDAGGFRKQCDTTGAETDAGYPEYAFTLDVGERVAALLRAEGARVVLTRDDSSGVGPCIDQRAALGNLVHADAALSIHADGGPEGAPGFHVIEPGLGPDGGNAAILAPSDHLALDLRAAYATGTGEPFAGYVNGGTGLIRRTDLGGLDLSRVPKVFIECANLRDAVDAVRVVRATWRQQAAAAIAAGLTAYLRSGG